MKYKHRNITQQAINKALVYDAGDFVVGNLSINANDKRIAFDPYISELTGKYIANTLSKLKKVGIHDEYSISVYCSGFNIEGLDEVNGWMLTSGQIERVVDNYTGKTFKVEG